MIGSPGVNGAEAAAASEPGPAPAPPRRVTARKVTSGFGWLALCQYSTRLIGFASTLILAKLLTPADFGLVAIASMMIEVMQLLRDMGLSEAVISSRREDRAALDTAHTVLVGYNVLLFVLAAAASPFVAQFYGNSTLIPIVMLMASNLVINSLRLLPLTLVRRNLEYRKLVLPDLVPATAASIVGIVMALMGFGVWSLVVKTLVNSVLALVLIQLIIPYRPRFGFDRAAARDLFGYGKFIVGSSILFVALYNIDRFFVSKIAGLALFGAYDLAARISDMPARQFSGLVGSVMFPIFSTMERSGAALRGMFLRTIKYTVSITFPAAVTLAAFGPALVDKLYGPRWAALGTLLRLMAVYAALRSTSSIVHDLFKSVGRPDLMQRATLVRLVTIGGLGAPVLYTFGVPGIAALLVITFALVLLWELTRVSALLEMPVSTPLGLLARPIGLAVTVIPIGYGLARQVSPLTSGWHLVSAIVVSGAAYAAALFWLDKDIAVDFQRIRESVRRPASATQPSLP